MHTLAPDVTEAASRNPPLPAQMCSQQIQQSHQGNPCSLLTQIHPACSLSAHSCLVSMASAGTHLTPPVFTTSSPGHAVNMAPRAPTRDQYYSHEPLHTQSPHQHGPGWPTFRQILTLAALQAWPCLVLTQETLRPGPSKPSCPSQYCPSPGPVLIHKPPRAGLGSPGTGTPQPKLTQPPASQSKCPPTTESSQRCSCTSPHLQDWEG